MLRTKLKDSMAMHDGKFRPPHVGVGRWSNIGIVVLVFAVLGLFAAPAPAQMGGMMGMGAGAGVDGLSKRTVTAMATALGFSADQREAAGMLYDGHREARKKLTDDFQNGIKTLSEKFRDEQDFSVWRTEMPKLSEKFQKDVKTLENEFMASMKSLLTPEQNDNWPRAERVQRRSKYLRVALMSGQAVDLVDVTNRVAGDSAAQGAVSEVLSGYELQMDRLLETYEKLADETQAKARDAGAGMGNPNAVQEMMKPIVEKATEIRNLNRDVSRRLGPMLSESQREAFEQEFKRKSHPRVYRETHLEKSIDAALKLPDLDASQRDALAALQTSFRRDAAPLNEGWAKAVEEKEEKSGGTVGAMMQGFMSQGADDDVSKARKARRALEEQAQSRLGSILREDQKSKLPEKKPEGGNPWDFMGGGNEEEE